ncbi:MlaC/ttg2D family ABC transporter substrate-binding protein [Hyphococcus sp.]|jgi:phospholipid transport system substrate-binding protein|uniref:MlaC/ttg2D family ABC transporter substrate-binding protein n=1 Tax=Hyphococcus sp. TaxID=2038636 RepID=UPI003D0B5244
MSLTRRAFAALSAASLIGLGIASPASADQAAETYVQNILDEAAPKLQSGDKQAMFAAVDDLVDKYVDMRRVGRFVLGKYARQMTDAQAAEYFPLFADYAKMVYRNTMENYAGQKLMVTGSVDRAAYDIVVNSKIANPEPGDQFADALIHWRIYRDKEGAMSIFDAGANEIWLAIEQQEQFTSIIANNGGGEKGIDALIAEMKARLKS